MISVAMSGSLRPWAVMSFGVWRHLFASLHSWHFPKSELTPSPLWCCYFITRSPSTGTAASRLSGSNTNSPPPKSALVLPSPRFYGAETKALAWEALPTLFLCKISLFLFTVMHKTWTDILIMLLNSAAPWCLALLVLSHCWHRHFCSAPRVAAEAVVDTAVIRYVSKAQCPS